MPVFGGRGGDMGGRGGEGGSDVMLGLVRSGLVYSTAGGRAYLMRLGVGLG